MGVRSGVGPDDRAAAGRAGERDLKRSVDQARSVAQTIDERRQGLEDRLGQQRELLRQVQAIRPPKPPPVPVKVSLSAPVLPSLSLAPVGQGAKSAVAAAYALLGRDYRYGAEGPDTFDCSGLTRFTWRSAGVSLPHSAEAQFDSLPHVSPDASSRGPGVLRKAHPSPWGCTSGGAR